jgi:hypothetical protein
LSRFGIEFKRDRCDFFEEIIYYSDALYLVYKYLEIEARVQKRVV